MILYPLEFFYKLCFIISRWLRRLKTLNHRFSFSIISVGNLTVGGTGKSVFVAFLARVLGEQESAIVLRGYKGTNEQKASSIIVSDGVTLLQNAKTAGDEAIMHAQSLKSVVVVGKNRARSCLLLEKLFGSKIRYALLDDAYQNYAVRKDLEILLVDARAPFDNGHCLPAGRLREKDYTRADSIILTHADLVDAYELKKLHALFFPTPVFNGAHAFDGLWLSNVIRVDTQALGVKRFLLSAGVGSIGGVRATAGQGGVHIALEHNFANHHAYNSADITTLYDIVKVQKLDGIVITAKDWVKIEPLLGFVKREQAPTFFVMRVVFEFLSEQEYDKFLLSVHKTLKVHLPHKKESGCSSCLCVIFLLCYAHFLWGFI